MLLADPTVLQILVSFISIGKDDPFLEPRERAAFPILMKPTSIRATVGALWIGK